MLVKATRINVGIQTMAAGYKNEPELLSLFLIHQKMTISFNHMVLLSTPHKSSNACFHWISIIKSARAKKDVYELCRYKKRRPVASCFEKERIPTVVLGPNTAISTYRKYIPGRVENTEL
jgi:hypothetical protein